MTADIDPGCVRVRLASAAGRISEVCVASERPVLAGALRGRPADEVVRLVPLLFALCGQAQGRAATLALAAARGTETVAHLDASIQREALREHLWRWLLTLPPLLNEAAMPPEFVTAARWIAADQRAALGEFLAGSRIAALCRRLEEIEDTLDGVPCLLPSMDAQDSLTCWPQLDSEFCQRPHWRGAPAETGAFARRQGRAGTTGAAFAARWRARLDELRDWAGGTEKVSAGGTASSVRLAPGRGRALVETARGLLMHEIALDGEGIADYLIVAPTEWNFHPQGPLAGWLAGRDTGDREAVERFVARAVAALDPCVRWELEWL